jgi:hypothetical protein
MNGQIIRGMEERDEVLQAIDIPRVGFGSYKAMRRLPVGGLVSITIQRLFRMSCSCLIREPSDCGPPCDGCLAELEASAEEDAAIACLTMEQRSWLARPCWRHHQTCAYPLCGRCGCPRHVASAVDGKVYCVEHFQQVSTAIDFAQLVERRGSILAWLNRFFRWLFKPPSLP